MVLRIVILIGAMAVTFSGLAKADMLGPDNCGTCFGSTYLLTWNPTSVGTIEVVVPHNNKPDTYITANLYDVTLTIDATDFVSGTGVAGNWYIRDVAVKISNNVFGAPYSQLTAAPGAPSDWQVKATGLNNNDCAGGDAGSLCAEDGTTALASTQLSVFTWKFLYATDATTFFTDPLEAGVKAKYWNANHANGVITSEHITLQPQTVPDGGLTLMLLGGALFGLGVLRRRFSS